MPPEMTPAATADEAIEGAGSASVMAFGVEEDAIEEEEDLDDSGSSETWS